MLTVKALALWLAILGCAAFNGILREAILIPAFGKTAGLLLSGLLLSALILAITYIALPWLRPVGLRQLVRIGLGWLALTLLFELAFGRLQGRPWSALLEAYTFKEGNVWPLVLLATATAPYIAGRLRGVPRDSA
ncbi:hypothetical protein E5843_05810 [Luteimonas yindakuii]|uniref:hypothetical protein n=1 Tax=Luteimonas yindakuii TaxID=2565782 RepID=UPI0010A4403A|nr:hypothetical protein [Luteimonas yindakuii]QCO67420.1 hypothetical protein E5843_05810 [Luteimonas yindakuii]